MNARILVAVFSLCALSGPAFAHAHLKASEPAADSTVTQAPKSISLTFTEKLEPNFSGVTVTDGQGRDMEAGKPAISDVSMTVTLKPLAAGVYHVAWHALALDTHKTEGKYDFTVKP